MDVLQKGWFSEVDPFERAKIDRKQAAKGALEDDEPRQPYSGRSSVTSGESVNMEQIQMGEAWPGQAFSLRVKEVLFDERSDYQHVFVAKTKHYGNMLVLDDIIQCTERDEFMYQEMLTHLAMFSHPDPKKVLIIGGGDGGCVREVLRHPGVEQVVLCEIDKMVIDVSRKYLPSMSCALDHPQVTIFNGDGFKFLKEHEKTYDVIITDSSDPIGPAESLFGKGYYELIRDALTDQGVLASQAESMFLHLGLIVKLKDIAKSLFPQVAYASGIVPTYPSGHMGYLLATKDQNADLKTPRRRVSVKEADAMGLRFYNSRVHESAFVLPMFAHKALYGLED